MGSKYDKDGRCFDATTGKPFKDGYVPTGARRPLSRKPGDILDGDNAGRVDKFDAEWGDGPFSTYSPWPIDE